MIEENGSCPRVLQFSNPNVNYLGLPTGTFSQNNATYAFMPPAAVAKNGLFFGGGMEQLMPQLIAIGVTALITFPLSLGVWFALKAALGIRVSRDEELEGLDIGEHGAEAYPDFVPQLAKS